MKILREKAFRRELVAFLLVVCILGLLFLILSPLLALGAFLCGVLLCCLLVCIQSGRRKQMEKLARELGGILRGEEQLEINSYTEGELAVLRCELEKLLQQIQSTKAAAIEDRKLLADSLADISHQLRTPLTSMELIVTMLRSPALPEERRLPLLRDLSRRTEQLQWLVEALLKLSQLDAGAVKLRPEVISVRELVEIAAEPLAVSMELREIRFTVQDPGLHLRCDRQWTAEALGNLLKNAIEHSPTGGSIEVCAEETPLYLQLTVRDEGPGFTEEEIDRLFERFYRGSSAAPGSYGIGLSLARRILSEQNATIRAANAPKGGALFTIRFYKTIV